MDCSLPGFSVHAISQVRILGVGCRFLLQGNLPDPELAPRDRTRVSCIGRQILYHCAIWEAQGILITTPQISTYKSIFAYQWFGKIFCTLGGWEAVMNSKEFHPS